MAGLAMAWFLHSLPARAADQNRPRWTAPSITLAASSHNLPAGVTHREMKAALTRAASAWSHPSVSCTSLGIHVAPASALRKSANDSTNLIAFRNQRWCKNDRCSPGAAYPARAAAITTLSDSSGTLRDADIELNGVAFDWDPAFGAALQPANTPGAKPKAPLVAVLVHEIGHALGFEDVCVARLGHFSMKRAENCPGDQQTSAMIPGTSRTELAPFDVKRLCESYPREDSRTAVAKPRSASGCHFASRPAPASRALFVLFVVWFAVWFARRRRTDNALSEACVELGGC